jgi:hypothetical protein
MSITINNELCHIQDLKGKILRTFGEDRTGQINYSINSQGWRAWHDYNSKPRAAVFGCSLVFGIGVPQEKIFTSIMPETHNYGMAGAYNNIDIYSHVIQYLKLFGDAVPVIICWTNRDRELLPEICEGLNQNNIFHFFCGSAPSKKRCYNMPPDQDKDISNTHMGPMSHDLFGKILCKLLNL